jgi:hypothetical protein
MPEEVLQEIVRFDVDTAATRRLQREIASIRAGLQDLKKTARQLDAGSGAADLGESLNEARQEAVKFERDVTDATQAVKQLARESKKVQIQPADTARQQGRSFNAGLQATRLANLAGSVGLQPVSGALRLADDIFDAADAAKALKGELPGLIGSLGLTTTGTVAATVALGAMAAAILVGKDTFDEIAASANAAQQAVGGQITALRQYYDFIGKATSDDLSARTAENLDRQRLNSQLLEDLNGLKSAVLAGVDINDRGALETFAEGSVRALDALGLLDYGLDDLDKAINEVSASLTAERSEFNLLARARVEGATAMNDQRAFEEQITKDRIAALEREAQAEIQTAELIRIGSSDQVRIRQEQITNELEAYRELATELEPLIATSDEAGQKLAGVRNTISLLEEESSRLTNTIAPAVEAHEQQVKALELLEKVQQMARQGTEALTGSVSGLADSVDAGQLRLQEYQEEQARVDADRALDVARAEEDYSRERTDKIADHYDDLAQLDQKYFEDRQDILDDMRAAKDETNQERLAALDEYNQEAQRASRDHQKRIQDIQRSTQTDIAAARLDAIGVDAAQRRGEEQLREENEQYKESERQRQEEFKDTLKQIERERSSKLKAGAQALRDLDAQHARERAEKERQFWLELSREQQEYQIQQQRQQQDWQIEDQRRQQHYGVVETETGTHYSTLYGMTVTGFANIRAAWDAGMSLLASVTPPSPAVGAPTYSAPIYGGGGYRPAYAGGGIPPVGRDVIVGERGPEYVRFMQPARVYSAAETRAMMSRGITWHGDINPVIQLGNIGGRSDRDLIALIKRGVEHAMTDQFEAMG